MIAVIGMLRFAQHDFPASISYRWGHFCVLFLDPFASAGVTLPVVFADGNGKGQKEPETVGPEAIDFFESDVERITAGTTWLGVGFADLFFAELGWDRLVQNGASRSGVLLMHLQANAADGVREEPVHANQVAVGQGAGDSSGL